MSKNKFEQDHDVKYFCKLPYRWKWKETFKNFWNPNESRIFPPKKCGIGWDINFEALAKKLKK